MRRVAVRGRSQIPDIFGAGSVLNVGQRDHEDHEQRPRRQPVHERLQRSVLPVARHVGDRVHELLRPGDGRGEPVSTDPNAVRRVSYLQEWRPATLDPEDRMYRAYDGIVNGVRFINDDGDLDPLTGDGLFDEDFLDGRDNDGDGRIDEDYAAIGQQMYTCVIRDDTPQAVAAAAAERHVPLGGDVGRGVECRQSAWAYSIPGFTDFNVVNWHFFNRSGHELDSIVIGFRVDFDAGPVDKSNFFSDDFDANMYPFGNFLVVTKDNDGRLQPRGTHPPVPDGVDPDTALCPRMLITVQGFSIGDDDGDEAKTLGVPSFMLLDHTVDPLGENGPKHVGFRAFRSFPSGQPYVQGGNPTIDQQRFELMTGHENISSDPGTPAMMGFINQISGDQKSDYSSWASIGPWLRWPADGELDCTYAIGVRLGDPQARAVLCGRLPGARDDAAAHRPGHRRADVRPHRRLGSARQVPVARQRARRAAGVRRHLRGAAVAAAHRLPGPRDAAQGATGSGDQRAGLRDARHLAALRRRQAVPVVRLRLRLLHRCLLVHARRRALPPHLAGRAPPPSPNSNMGLSYNYSDNPDRRFPPAGDGQVTGGLGQPVRGLARSEERPVRLPRLQDLEGLGLDASGGRFRPAEDDWTLLAEYRLFDGAPDNKRLVGGNLECPNVYIPQKGDSVRICLTRGGHLGHAERRHHPSR
jgi:hypothetical protein